MKLVSWNVRGLGGLEKRKDVRKLVGEKKPFILCLQETKLSVCDLSLCTSLWGDPDHAFSYRPSVGALGGLLTLWDIKEVEVWSTINQNHMLQIHGRFIRTNEEFYLLNIYAPCEPRAKQELWVSLSARLQLLVGKKVYVCGDFNAIRNADERRSYSGSSVSLDFHFFNLFIEDNGLLDLSLCGHRFTWYKGDGTSMSRIDHFLLSEEWCFKRPNCF